MATVLDVKNLWRWLVTDLSGIGKTNLDRLATNVSIQYVLDDAAVMTCDLPSDNPEVYRHADDGEPFVSYGRRLLYGLRREEPAGAQPWVCRFSGVITILQDEADEDEPITHLTAHDSFNWAKALPVLAQDGSLAPSKGVTYTNKRGNHIAKDVLANAYAWMEATPSFKTGGHWKWTSSVAPDAFFIDIASGVFELTDIIPKITFQQGASVYDAWTQLCQTGGLDIVLDPIYDPYTRPGVLAVMNVYNQAGDDKPGAVFGWDMWPRNLSRIDDLRDGTQIENWAQFYAGGGIAKDPGGSGDPYHAKSDSSINQFGPYFVQQNIAGPSDATSVGLLSLAEVALRGKGKQTLQIDPAPERAPDPFTRWNLGDTVYVWGGRPMPPTGNALRAGVRSGTAPSSHRVYAFEVSLADDQVETIQNLLLTDPNGGSPTGTGGGSPPGPPPDAPLSAFFVASPPTGEAPLGVTFTDTSTPGPSGPITAWDWDFGDGSPHDPTENPPLHNYAAAGSYTARLTVTGTGTDGTSSTSMDIGVTDVAWSVSESDSGLAVGDTITFNVSGT